jgi:thiosulfate/3-mercaptopyruvate sulfurtransferase
MLRRISFPRLSAVAAPRNLSRTMSSSPLINPSDLLPLVESRSATTIDASWYLPAAGREGRKEFLERRIPGAAFFDINGPGLSDTSSTLPHMLPRPEEFAPAAAALGITKRKPVVVYDGAGLFSAARVWWTLKAFGHPSVYVLDGGLPLWLSVKMPVESGDPSYTPVEQEKWELDAGRVRSLQQVLDLTEARRQAYAAAAAGSALRAAPLLVDARPALRFLGDAPEPRAGLASGHAPFARSVPHSTLLDASAHNRMLPPERLREVFGSAGVDVTRPGDIVCSCGSGVTAAVVNLALIVAGRPFEKTAVYDGSFAEYGAAARDHVVKGPAEESDASEL